MPRAAPAPDAVFALCDLLATVLRVASAASGAAVLSALAFDGADVALVPRLWAFAQGAADARQSARRAAHRRGCSGMKLSPPPLSRSSRYAAPGADAPPRAVRCVLVAFCSALAHVLVVHDDSEIYEGHKPLPLHQLRRVVAR